MTGRRVEHRKSCYPISLDPRIIAEADKRIDPNNLDRQSRSSVLNEVLMKVFVEKSVET